MLKHIIATAVIVTSLSMVSFTPASAGGGGGDGGGDSQPYISDTFATITNPDGSTTTSRYDRCGPQCLSRNRKVTKRNRGGDVTGTRRYRKNYINRAGKRTSRPWARNHTTGRTSVGVQPGVRVVIGGGGISFSF